VARDDPCEQGSFQHQHEVSRIPDYQAIELTDGNSYGDPFERPVEYSPTDKKVMDLELAKARRLLRPHLLLIQVLSSQFQAVKYREPGIMMSLVRLVMRSLAAAKHMRARSLARRGYY
jgi:hypothetical protein